jgi:ELWxxDGT repeat protein
VLYFAANEDGGHRNVLWRSDGTTTGTYRVKTWADLDYWEIDHLVAVVDKLYFLHEPDTEDTSIWISDGTEGGTQPVMNLNNDFAGGATFYVPRLVTIGNQIYFTANDETTGMELWTITVPPLPQNQRAFLPLVKR